MMKEKEVKMRGLENFRIEGPTWLHIDKKSRNVLGDKTECKDISCKTTILVSNFTFIPSFFLFSSFQMVLLFIR